MLLSILAYFRQSVNNALVNAHRTHVLAKCILEFVQIVRRGSII